MNSIAPVWDGNETWLVLGGGGLFAAFPLAYAVILPGDLSADHRHAAGAGVSRRRVRIPLARSGHRRFWDVAFTGGSLVAAMAQGMTLGALLAGHRGRRPRLCRQLVRLADALHAADRARHGRGLCAARRDLAGLEAGRRRASTMPATLAKRAAWATLRADGRGQPLQRVPQRRIRRTLAVGARRSTSPRRCRS